MHPRLYPYHESIVSQAVIERDSTSMIRNSPSKSLIQDDATTQIDEVHDGCRTSGGLDAAYHRANVCVIGKPVDFRRGVRVLHNAATFAPSIALASGDCALNRCKHTHRQHILQLFLLHIYRPRSASISAGATYGRMGFEGYSKKKKVVTSARFLNKGISCYVCGIRRFLVIF